MRAWVDRAACAGMDTGYFFPEDTGRQHSAILALRICRGCEVREECLTWAMEKPEIHGIWGGTSPQRRHDMRRRQHGRPPLTEETA